MLAFQRLQTIIGREIHCEEMPIIAAALKTSVKLLCEEESTEPWKVEPEPNYLFEINNPELEDKILNKAGELGIEPDELVNRIIKLHIIRQELGI